MARGWESKSVDDQIAERETSRAPSALPLTQQERERESLILQRNRILLAISSSTNPRYIAQQRQALAFLDSKLGQLQTEG